MRRAPREQHIPVSFASDERHQNGCRNQWRRKELRGNIARQARDGFAGVELVDKHARRSAFLEGRVAALLRANVARLCAEDPEEDEVDEFLFSYEALLTHPIRMQ